MDAVSAFVLPGVLFLLALPFGLWLSRKGKPYSTLLFTAHKLIALGAVGTAALETANLVRHGRAELALAGLLALAGACIVALFASGALMSMNRPGQARLLAIHQAAVVLVLIIALAAFVLMAGRVA